MAVDPRLMAQLQALERENALLDQRLAEARKAAAEPKPRTLTQRFMDNLRDGWERSFLAARARSLSDPNANGRLDWGDLWGEGVRIRRGGLADRLTGGRFGTDAKPAVNAAERREIERRRQFAETSERDPFHRAPGGPLGKAAAGVATFAGQVAGAAGDPVNWVQPAGGVVRRVAGQAAMNVVSDAGTQQADIEAGVEDEFHGEQTVAAGLIGVGLAGSFEAARPAARWLKQRFSNHRGDAPALAETDAPEEAVRPSETPDPDPSPALLPPPEKTAQEAPEGAAATTPAEPSAPAVPDRPAATRDGPEASRSGNSEGSEGGSGPETSRSGNPEGDPWAEVDWGKMRSKQRAEAAQAHLDALKRFVKPEHVRAFVSALDEPEKAGQVGGGERVAWVNPRYIDWEKINASPEDLLQWTNIRASIFKDLYEKAGDGEKTWEDLDRAANLFGTRLSDLVKTHADLTGEGGIAARVGALRQVALESADAFAAELKKVRGEIDRGDFSNVGSLAASIQRVVLLESMATGAVSEVARALNYMKRLARPKPGINDLATIAEDFADAVNGGRPVDADTLKRAMDNLDQAYRKKGAAGVVREVSKLRELGLSDYVSYVVVGSLLSAPKTAIRNLLGTPVMQAFQVMERYVGAGIGAARSALAPGVSRRTDRMTFGEANAYVVGAIEGLHEGFLQAWRGFRTGAPTTGGGSWAGEALQRPVPFQLTRERVRSWTQNGFSLHSVMDAAGVAFFETIRTFAFRPMVAADEFYKAVGRRQQIAALAWREADLRARQADPKDRDRVFRETLEAIKRDPTAAAFREAKEWFLDNDLDPDAVFPTGSRAEELATLIRSVDIHAMAEDHAKLVTFQDGGPVVQAFERALRMVPLLKWFYVPFFKTTIALVRAGIIDRNPVVLGLVAGKNRQALTRLAEIAKADEDALMRGGAEADLALARLVVGGAFMSMAFMLWQNGWLVGRRGERGDPTKMDGVKEYSIRLPDGTWLQYSSLDPVIGSQLGLIADLAQALRDRPLDDTQAEAAVGAVFAAIRNNILNKAALSGVKEFAETFFGAGSDANDKVGGRQVSEGLADAAMNFVPLVSLLRATAQEQDPVVRDARTLLDNLKAVTPGWSDELPARRDVFGRPIIRKPGERGLFQAFATSRPTDDPLDLELSRLAQALPDFTLREPHRLFNKQRVEPEEYSRIQEVRGQLYRDRRTGLNMEEAAVELIASDEYATWTDERREKELKELVTAYRAAADAAIRDPDSEFHMPEMVRRTALAQLQKEHAAGTTGAKLRRRARALGLSREDVANLPTLLQQP